MKIRFLTLAGEDVHELHTLYETPETFLLVIEALKLTGYVTIRNYHTDRNLRLISRYVIRHYELNLDEMSGDGRSLDVYVELERKLEES